MDPCTPRGYAYEKEARRLSPISLVEKRRYMSTLSPGGNFSECRSASLKLLQRGKGTLSDDFTCFLKIFLQDMFNGLFYVKYRQMLLSQLLHRINIYSEAAGEVSGNREFLSHFKGVVQCSSNFILFQYLFFFLMFFSSLPSNSSLG